MGSNELVILDFDDIICSTEKALLLQIDDEIEVWVPCSLIRDLDTDDKEVTVPEWFANKAGLI